MARADKITVNTTVQKILDAEAGNANVPASIIVKVPTGGATLYLGGAQVDATDGFPVAAGESFAVDSVTEDIYAYCATSVDINCFFLRS